MLRATPTATPIRPERPEARFVRREGGRERLADGERSLDVPARDSFDELLSLTGDGTKLVVASNVRVREVDLETLAVRDLLQGPWLTHVRCLAGGLVAVLGREGTHRLERSDPDVAAMASVRDMPASLTWFEVRTPGMIFLLDRHARSEKLLVQSIAIRAERIDALWGGRVLAVGYEGGTTFYAVKNAQLVVMGTLEEKLGAVYEVERRVYGEGHSIEGIEGAYGAARVEETAHERVVVDGDFGFEPALAIPAPKEVPVHARALVGAGGWHADRRHGGRIFALTADPRGYRCAIVDESPPALRPITPPITGERFKYEMSLDGSRCVVATRDAVFDVDCATGEATRVAGGDAFVTVTLLGDLALAIHRDGVEGTLRIWKRTANGYRLLHSISCGKYDSLFSVHHGSVVMLASEYAPKDTRLRAHFIAARGGELAYLGRVLAPFKHAVYVDGESYVEDALGCAYRIVNLDFAMERAFARPRGSLEIAIARDEKMEGP